MGLVSWVRRAFGNTKTEPDEPADLTQAVSQIRLEVGMDFNRCVELAGTTTFAKDAVVSLADRKGLGERGLHECLGQLQPEPDNPVDPAAIAVIVEGEKIGNLPSGVAKMLPLHPGTSTPVRYQLHVLYEDGFRAKAYVWLDAGTPRWAHTADNPPPLTTRQRTVAAARGHSEMVKEALAGGGDRAEQFRAGMVDGVHYLQLIEPIKQLKREDRLQEALKLCYQAIEGAEKDSKGGTPAPAYTEQAAIIHRKLGERDAEIAVLKRWLNRTPKAQRSGSKIAERLAKLEAK